GGSQRPSGVLPVAQGFDRRRSRGGAARKGRPAPARRTSGAVGRARAAALGPDAAVTAEGASQGPVGLGGNDRSRLLSRCFDGGTAAGGRPFPPAVPSRSFPLARGSAPSAALGLIDRSRPAHRYRTAVVDRPTSPRSTGRAAAGRALPPLPRLRGRGRLRRRRHTAHPVDLGAASRGGHRGVGLRPPLLPPPGAE